jgi:hypothetical protein
MTRRLLFVAAALALFARLTVYAHSGATSNIVCLIVFGVCAAGWAVSAILA